MLEDGLHADAVLFELALIDGAVVSVAREAVQLVDKDDGPGGVLCIIDHAEERWAVVGHSRLGLINIGVYEDILFSFAIFPDGSQLRVNGFLALVVAGKAGIGGYIG